MKGIAICLVVMGHVLASCYSDFGEVLRNGTWDEMALWRFIYCFHMPLFMAISGFVAFNPTKNYSAKNVTKRLATYLLPYFFAGFLYGLYRNDLSLEKVMEQYWYFKTLSQYILIIFILMKLTDLLPIHDQKTKDCFVALAFFFIGKIIFKFGQLLPDDANIIDINHFAYFRFFLAGWLFRRFAFLDKIVSNIYCRLLCLSCFFAVMINQLNTWGLFQYAAIIVVLNMSKILDGKSSYTTWLLKQAGENTMIIYILHFFLLPNLPFIEYIFKDISSYGTMSAMLIMAMVSIPLTCGVIWISLKIFSLLRNNPLIDTLLFGNINRIKELSVTKTRM